MLKNLLAKQEMQVSSLGQKNPLEKEMAPNSNILAWRIPWTEEPIIEPISRIDSCNSLLRLKTMTDNIFLMSFPMYETAAMLRISNCSTKVVG